MDQCLTQGALLFHKSLYFHTEVQVGSNAWPDHIHQHQARDYSNSAGKNIVTEGFQPQPSQVTSGTNIGNT